MNAPPPEQILLWKQSYDEVFSLEAGGSLFIFRALTFQEYDSIIDRIDSEFTSVDAEDHTVKMGILYPSDFNPDDYSPGVVSTLADEIKDMSGFGEVYRPIQLLKDWRQRIGGIRGEMKTFVMFAFPSYSSVDLDEMTFYRLAELTALAERVIFLRQISEGMDVREPMQVRIITPEEAAAKAKQKISARGNATVSDPIAQRLMSSM